MSGHLDLDELADVLAGVDQPAHLSTCASCQAALSELSAAMTSVSAALSQLPDPVVPDDLAERIAAAIAQESPSLPSAPFVASAAATVTPLQVARSGRPRWLAPAGGLAAAALLVVGGIVVFGSGGSHTTSTAAKAAREQAGIARSATGTDYDKDGTALAGTLKALLKGNAPPAAHTTAGVNPAAPSAVASDALKGAVSAPLDPLAALRTTDGLAGCLSSLTDPSDPGVPLALDYGSFAGQPALLVLLPSSKPSFVEAYFVGPGCAPKDAKLLFFQKVRVPN